MKFEDFKREMNDYRHRADVEGRRLKDSYIALQRLAELYEGLGAQNQKLANQVLCDWVESDDEGVRFDALALINRFRIAGAVPALRKLEKSLSKSKAAGAPFEHQKVQKLIGSLTEGVAD